MKVTEGVPSKLAHLTSNELKALNEIVARLHEHYGEDLIHVVLFGSKARGDHIEESDLDILIVLKMHGEDYWDHWEKISDLTWEIELEYGIVTSMLIKDKPGYDTMREHGLLLYQNIERDGIPLWTRRPSEPTFKPV